jgi:hypothetical protein
MSRLPKRKLTEKELLEKAMEELEKAKRYVSSGRRMALSHHLNQADAYLHGAVNQLNYVEQLLRVMKDERRV